MLSFRITVLEVDQDLCQHSDSALRQMPIMLDCTPQELAYSALMLET